jgi:hypothetical protein
MGIWALARTGEARFRAFANENKTVVDRLTRWIPGDMLALFATVVTAIAAMTSPEMPQWIWLAVCIFATPALVLLIKPADGKPDPQKPKKALLGLIAFVIWSLTIPDSAWHNIAFVTDNAPLVAGLAALGGIFFGLLAENLVTQPPA